MYVQEATENEKKGLKIKVTKKPLILPPDLRKLLVENKLLTKTFNALTLTKKREFSDYISEAKQDETKAKRIEKIIPMFLNSKGFHENYKNY
ncbi:MAG: YdeI/OmpD-associated family protein [Aureibaculum sp.]|nr:YdeI/OmpD-associated family protein [Aureibaculum sp.]